MLFNLTSHLRARHLSLLLVLFTPLLFHAQISGTVLDDEGWAMTGATVQWLPDGAGTTVDADGNFVLPASAHERFRITFLGYAPREFQKDTLTLPLRVTLYEDGVALTQVQVSVRDNGSSASLLQTHNIESISSKELRKAPCCSLAESFENSPVVDLAYGDPLTGRREIQLLGLSGRYAQLTLEKRPMLDGLASPYALDLIPGPWAQSLQLSKGSASLASGAQGIAGAINTELIKPTDGPKLFVNTFANSQGRGELNVLTNHQLGKTLWGGASLHGSFTDNEQDHDDDGFKDMPDRRTGVGLFRLFRKGEDNWEGQWNLLVARDRRSAGQFTGSGGPIVADPPYRIEQDNQRVEAWGKTGYFGFAKPHQSLGVIYSGSYHQLNNQYGRKTHVGEQRSAYLNVLYHTRIVNDAHQLALGATGRVDNFTESLAGRDFSRNENTLGGFGEYTYHWEASEEGAAYRAFTAILALRADRHNLGGYQLSPRLNVKYNPSEQTALRASIGRGWRSPNLLVDNLNWLPSSRTVHLGTDDNEDPATATNPGFLGLETAWNYGVNFTHDFAVNGKSLQFVFDALRTEFQNQIVVDAEQDLSTLRLYQLDGPSRANSLLVSANYEVLPLIDVKLAYKYTDVQQTYATNGLREVPLTPRNRVLATVGYDGRRVKAHLNYHWTGEQRLIDFDRIPETVSFSHPQRTPAFGLLNAQLTYVANSHLEIYGGGENLTNRTQRNAIIGSEGPFFEPYFDASQVYQPLYQRRYFLGLRYTL